MLFRSQATRRNASANFLKKLLFEVISRFPIGDFIVLYMRQAAAQKNAQQRTNDTTYTEIVLLYVKYIIFEMMGS